jgi:hypothetical protein
MNTKKRILISSVQKELELERAAVAGLISTGPFLLPSSMIALKTSGVCSHVNQ